MKTEELHVNQPWSQCSLPHGLLQEREVHVWRFGLNVHDLALHRFRGWLCETGDYPLGSLSVVPSPPSLCGGAWRSSVCPRGLSFDESAPVDFFIWPLWKAIGAQFAARHTF